ncbi:Histone-lysine N-methyltransferase ASHR1 [Diplonema papillatum]|nr:Histone-lysine N-methyltransferase ASHR1 [Diplonema papillatum]
MQPRHHWSGLDITALRVKRTEKENRLKELSSDREAAVQTHDQRRAVLRAQLDAARAELSSFDSAARAAAGAAEAAETAGARSLTAAAEKAAAASGDGLDDSDTQRQAPAAHLGFDQVRWKHRGWLPDGAEPKCVCLQTGEKGRFLVASSDIAAGEAIFYDSACLDVPASVDGCLLASELQKRTLAFRQLAKAGKFAAKHSVKSKELDTGIVLLTKVENSGKDAEQGFAVTPASLTGVVFKDGVLPVLAQFFEAAHGAKASGSKAKCFHVFDLYCPMKEADPELVASYMSLSTAYVHSLAALAEYRDVLTIDQAVRLLLTVQCNAISIRRSGYSGIAVFPFASLMEHNCNPSATAQVMQETGDTGESIIKVVALRPIEKGQPISISYGGPYLPTAERRGLLQQTYRFVCVCDTCRGPDKSRAFVDQCDDRYAFPASTEEAEEQLLQLCRQVEAREVALPVTVMPVETGSRCWGGARSLETSNPLHNLTISSYLQAEKEAIEEWPRIKSACQASDWEPLKTLLTSPSSVLHQSHYIQMSLVSQVVPVAFRASLHVTLWLLRCSALNTCLVEGPAKASIAVAEHAEIAARALLQEKRTDRATAFLRMGLGLLEALGLAGTLAHHRMTSMLQTVQTQVT